MNRDTKEAKAKLELINEYGQARLKTLLPVILKHGIDNFNVYESGFKEIYTNPQLRILEDIRYKLSILDEDERRAVFKRFL